MMHFKLRKFERLLCPASLSVIATLLLTACAPSSYVTLLENPDGSTGKVIVTGAEGSTTIDKAHFGAALDGSSKELLEISEAQIKKDFTEALTVQPMLPKKFLLYFETGGAKLTQESEKKIPEILEEVKIRPAVDISVIGHTDTEGDAQKNEELGQVRAQSIYDLLEQQNIKVHAATISSHGEKNLLVPTADNVSEPLNRRVEISIR